MKTDDFEKQLRRQPLRPVPGEWRAEILHAAGARQIVAPRAETLLATVRAALAALLWPHPRAWAGLVAAWVVIVSLNYAAADRMETRATRLDPPSPERPEALREQKGFSADLLNAPEPPPAELPRPFVPRPRSEERTAIRFV